MPKISIIVPVYNVEKYLPRCLDSLISQTLDDIEILCIDDGSMDNSLEILQKYAEQDARVKVFSQENAGVAQARNLGLKHMQGQYLMFCDSDDWYEPIMCEKMLQTITCENVDFVLCNTILQDIGEDSARQVGKMKDKYRLPAGEYLLDTETKQRMSVVVWDKIFRTDYIKKYNLFFPPVAPGEDMVFVHQYMALSKKCIVLEDKLYNYLLRGTSLIGAFLAGKQNQKSDFFKAMKYECDFLTQHNLLQENESFVLHTIEHNFILVWSSLDPAYQRDIMEQAADLFRFFPKVDVNRYGQIIRFLKYKKFRALKNYLDRQCGRTVSWAERLFSIKNSKDKRYKLIYVLGIRFQLRKKSKKGA